MKTLPIITAVIILLVFFTACSEEVADLKTGEKDRISVRTAESEEGTYIIEKEYTGTFFANKEANLGTSMPGKVEKFHYQRGTKVKKGSLLVELSSEVLTQALIEYETLHKDFERVSRLREKGSVSEIEYDHLKAKLDASEVRKQMLKKNTSIIAPFDGVIVDYLVEEGENYFFNINLEPGYSHTSGILRLMQLNPIKVIIEVNENDLKYVQVGTEAKIICDAVDKHNRINGRVSYIKPILSTISRTAEVEIQIQNPGNKIMPGMFARVIFESESVAGIKVPLSAIYRQPGTPEDFVFVIEDNIAKRTPVTRLKTEGDMVYIDGIDKGLIIATEGKNRLSCGSMVKIVK